MNAPWFLSCACLVAAMLHPLYHVPQASTLSWFRGQPFPVPAGLPFCRKTRKRTVSGISSSPWPCVCFREHPGQEPPSP